MKSQVICYDRDWNEELISPDRLKFRPSVYGLLIKDGQVILTPKWDGHDFPGGGVHIDETLEEALEREFWEETGLKIKVLSPIEVTTSFFKCLDKKGELSYSNCPMIYFLVEYVSGELSDINLTDREKKYSSLARWFDFDELPELHFYNALRERSVALVEYADKIIKTGKN
jgi:8-oxo-dGTP pyrophosphatase MutT (NUDIX family)